VDELRLPGDLVAFLEAGKQLTYDASACEAGLVVLMSRDGLRLRTFAMHCASTPLADDDPHRGESGCYRVPGVDLVADCSGDYTPEGLLIWLPEELRFGTWDCDHDLISVFGPEVTWTQIANTPARFLNAQWEFDDLDRAPAEFLVPWPR
jgi:hypothetical protein